MFGKNKFFFQVKLNIISVLLLLIASRLFCTPTNFNGQWQSENIWTLETKIPKPEFIISGNDVEAKCQLVVPQLNIEARIGYPEIPFFVKMINALPDEITTGFHGSDEIVETLPAPIKIFYEIPKDGEPGNNNDYDNEIHPVYQSSKQSVSVEFVGYLNGAPISKIIFYPYKIINDGLAIKYYKNITLSVSIQSGNKINGVIKSQNNPIFSSLGFLQQNIRTKQFQHFPKAVLNPLIGKQQIKIIVDRDGIYRLTKKSLVDDGAVFKNLDPRTFCLRNRGVEIPIFVSGESDGVFNNSDYIEFVGFRNRNSVAEYEYDPFTNKNVYWLSWGFDDGLRYAEESAKPTVSADNAIYSKDYLYTQHFEKNDYFARLGRVDTDHPTFIRDHWFFDSGINTGTKKDYLFDLIHPNINSTKAFNVEVGMHGLTYQEYHHDVDIHINNYFTASGQWSDQKLHVIRNELSTVLFNNYLQNGINEIQISVVGDDATAKYDKVLFDYLKIQYHRLYKARDDFIDFLPPKGYPEGLYHFSIDNFDNPEISVYKVGKSRMIDFDINYNRHYETYSLYLEDYVHNDSTLYFAASGDGILTPLLIQPDTLLGIRESSKEGDLIIIIKDMWQNEINELLEFYEEIGYHPVVQTISDIYNEFNFGIISPFALKDYFKYAKNNWSTDLTHVLLIGDARIMREATIPSLFFQSYKYGACVSDHWYTLVGENENIPEFAIGRWPCSTKDELELLIEKRISYDKNSFSGFWKNELLFIAGYEDQFKNQSEEMIYTQIEKDYGVNRIYVNPSNEGTQFWGGSDTLISLFNRGLSLINYMGHGGGAVWADRSLFNTSHISSLDNYDRLPFITSMTCFTGDFANLSGLGMYLLLAENGGAIGLWGSSSVGWIKNDYLLAKPFYDVIFTPGMTVGQAIQTAKIKYLAENYFDYLKMSLMNAFNLIGDPTVKIPFTRDKVEVEINKDSPEPGDNITLNGKLPFSDGQAFVNIYDRNKIRLLEEPLSSKITSNTWSYNLTLPAGIDPGNAYINYFMKNDDGDEQVNGAVAFNIKGLNYYNFYSIPARPHKDENFILGVEVDVNNFSNLYCEIDTISAYEYLDQSGIEHVISFQNSELIDSIGMSLVSGNRWQINTPVSLSQSNKLIAIRFVVTDENEEKVVSPIYTIHTKTEPDIYPVSIEQKLGDFPELWVKINYFGDDTINVQTKILRGSGELFGKQSTTLLPNRGKTIKMSGILGFENEIFNVIVDPDNEIEEKNESNNHLIDTIFVNVFPVLPGIGTTINGIENNTISIDQFFSCNIPPESAVDSFAFCLSKDSLINNSNQPDFELISPFPDISKKIYSLKVNNNIYQAKLNMLINIKVDSVISEIENLQIGRWDYYLQTWIIEESQKINQNFSTQISSAGKFCLIRCEDYKSPGLELNLEGQRFFQDSYVSRRPNISIVAEDENGIRFDKDGVKIFLDDVAVDFSSLSLPDTIIEGNYIAARFRPELDWGEHIIDVTLFDAAGNMSSERIEFIVSNELKLFDYGNFPNPFKTRTAFIYELTQRVETFKISIYTISGRLIRTLDNNSIYTTGLAMNDGGYHEILWDGLDDSGNFVANGVYFYKIYARKDNKSASSIGKIAKTR